ncbi:MAG: hypothetical protein KDK70_09855 [Myxococcales bacterium]|nr:hypothetical protein [Myxococcales bacterium]
MLATILAAGLWAGGCGKRAPATEAPDSRSTAGEEAAADWVEQVEGDPLGDAQAELEGYEASLLEAGIELPEPVRLERAEAGMSATPATAGPASAERCQRICDLAANICTLRDRICDLASEHEGQERYASACERASLDCDRATEACEGCDA